METPGTTRREFLKAVGAGGAAATAPAEAAPRRASPVRFLARLPHQEEIDPEGPSG